MKLTIYTRLRNKGVMFIISRCYEHKSRGMNIYRSEDKHV